MFVAISALLAIIHLISAEYSTESTIIAAKIYDDDILTEILHRLELLQTTNENLRLKLDLQNLIMDQQFTKQQNEFKKEMGQYQNEFKKDMDQQRNEFITGMNQLQNECIKNRDQQFTKQHNDFKKDMDHQKNELKKNMDQQFTKHQNESKKDIDQHEFKKDKDQLQNEFNKDIDQQFTKQQNEFKKNMDKQFTKLQNECKKVMDQKRNEAKIYMDQQCTKQHDEFKKDIEQLQNEFKKDIDQQFTKHQNEFQKHIDQQFAKQQNKTKNDIDQQFTKHQNEFQKHIDQLQNEFKKDIDQQFTKQQNECKKVMDQQKNEVKKDIDQQFTKQQNESKKNFEDLKELANCVEALKKGGRSGIYKIKIPNSELESFDVYCLSHVDSELEKITPAANSSNAAWTIVQRRQDGSIDFYRNWTEYQQGFGNLDSEFFIGLDKLHALTQSTLHELWVQMEDFDGIKRWAKYSRFAIGGKNESYILNDLGAYTGDAGDSLSAHSGQKWTTKDVDNDKYAEGNCAQHYHGAWWYKRCYDSHLNGLYLRGANPVGEEGLGISWMTFNETSSIKYVHMAIKPVQ